LPSYTFPADANIRELDGIWKNVKELLNAPGAELELDASAIERPDTAFVQMLAVTVLRAREQGKTPRVVKASQRLRDLVKLVALDMVLAD
jgi:ABC-type transporter Mla MlaB component